MGRPRRQPSPRAAALRTRIEQWRRIRAKRSPMPGSLWSKAVALARADGLHATAHALGLRYESLKWRVAAVGDGLDTKPAASPTFMQLAPLPGYPAPAAGGTVVEVSDGHGGQLTIRLPSTVAVDVVDLAVAFVGRGA